MQVVFARGKAKLSFSSNLITITNENTDITTKTLYFAIQAENAAGRNLASDLIPVSIASGSKISISPPQLASGEWWTNYIISASATNDPAQLVQLGKIPFLTVGGNINTAPLILSKEEHLTLSGVVATASLLPKTPVNGTMRGIQSVNAIFEYNLLSVQPADGANVIAAAVGNWIKSNRNFSTAIADIYAEGGCGQDILAVANPTANYYAGNGSPSSPIRLWLLNNTTSSEPQGRRVGFTVKVNNELKTALFASLGAIKLTFRGYVNSTTLETRTVDEFNKPFDYLNQEISLTAGPSKMSLPDDLAPGEAYAVDVRSEFKVEDVVDGATDGVQIRVSPFLFDEAGAYTEAGSSLGDVIYAIGDKCLVVPNIARSVRVLGGSGMIDSFSFPEVGEKLITGLLENRGGQAVYINGNGGARISPLPFTRVERIRAIVSTLNGTGRPGNWSALVKATSSNDKFIIRCNYPYLNGRGIVRGDYPDFLLAGNNKATFNPTKINIYVKYIQGTSEQIRVFKNLAVVAGTFQDFILPDWNTGEITALPTCADDFGLFAPGVSVLTNNTIGSSTGSVSFQACFAFEYTNVVTAISHDEADGCIFTMTTPLNESLARTKHWASPRANTSELSQIDAKKSINREARIANQSLYFFAADSTDNADNLTTVYPSSQSANSPGRWKLQRFPSLIFNDSYSPLLANNETGIYITQESNFPVPQLRVKTNNNSSAKYVAYLDESQMFKAAQGCSIETYTFDLEDPASELVIDMKKSNRFKFDLIRSSLTLSFINFKPGMACEIKFKQSGAGNNNVTFPTYCKFPENIIPTLALTPGRSDILACVCFEENILNCVLTKNFWG